MRMSPMNRRSAGVPWNRFQKERAEVLLEFPETVFWDRFQEERV